ncbi:MAG: response regulator transcription factor [Saprospiraceae bacterium]|jgi:DNA-binding NarL/FixJ family response regulator
MRYNIAIIEDDPEVLQLMGDYFQRSAQVNCVLALDTVEKFLKFHRDFMQVHLVLLDVMLHGQSSIRSIPKIRKRVRDAEIVMFTFMDDSDTVFQALRNGATGYMVKEDPPEEIERKILYVLQGGGALLSPAIAKKIIEYFDPGKVLGISFFKDKLSDKERSVMQMLKDGHDYNTIARHIGMSVDGVRYYVKNLYRKLQVSSRGELLRKYFFL